MAALYSALFAALLAVPVQAQDYNSIYATYPQVPKTASINGFADPIFAKLPECAQSCVRETTRGTPCPYWDTGCLCIMPQFINPIADCFAKNCQGQEVVSATSLASSLCHSVGAWFSVGATQSTELAEAATKAAESTAEATTAASSSAAGAETVASTSAAPASTAPASSSAAVAAETASSAAGAASSEPASTAPASSEAASSAAGAASSAPASSAHAAASSGAASSGAVSVAAPSSSGTAPRLNNGAGLASVAAACVLVGAVAQLI